MIILVGVITLGLVELSGFGVQRSNVHAQTQSLSDPIDWAIGGYSETVGYSQYQFQWIPTPINSSNINYGGVLNIAVKANGTEALNGDGAIATWIQAAVYITSSGTYYPCINVWALTYDGPPQYSQNPTIYTWPSLPISPNGQIAFIELNYMTYASHTGWWYILGLGTGSSPSSLVYLAVLTYSGGIYYLNDRGGYSAGASPGLTAVGNRAADIQNQGEYVYPSIGLQINENSYGQFTASNPAFRVYGSFFARNDYLSGVNYANSSRLSADYGFMAGESSPPATLAESGGTFYPPNGGATEYTYAFGTPEGIHSSGQLTAYTQIPGTDLATLKSVTGNAINSFVEHDVIFQSEQSVAFASIQTKFIVFPAFLGMPLHPPPWYWEHPYELFTLLGLIFLAAYLIVFLLPSLVRYARNKNHK
ncbi:MAG: hypothetical protein QXV17_10000 [Candidatus Micrarchaeaceae archaeon]